ATERSLHITGPFAHNVPNDRQNLVLRAAELFTGTHGARITLEKNLPAAAGIGGGSADAAAALHLLSALWQLPMPDNAALLTLGADVPVCVSGTAMRMTDVGGCLEPISIPSFHAVLINPLIGLSTLGSFRGLKNKGNEPLGKVPGTQNVDEWLEYLAQQRNDLCAPATKIVGEIRGILDALDASAGCALARMSGSGASCFGLYRSQELAENAAQSIRTENPNWWVQPVKLAP
ncbi:MAG: 4-diphosphocytidyl-2-C-methyl-D-erythritol kinase, partial [Planctomycetota bacterium]